MASESLLSNYRDFKYYGSFDFYKLNGDLIFQGETNGILNYVNWATYSSQHAKKKTEGENKIMIKLEIEVQLKSF